MNRLANTRGRWFCSLAIALAAAGACNRSGQAPPSETQTATPVQTANMPTTITGCLRAGDASNTFVLTAARAETGQPTATYQLHPVEGVMLAEHVGKQVEVSGVLRAQQEVSSRSTTEPANKATGTTGTPTVSTATELDIKQLTVEKVRSVEGECPADERK